MLIDIHTHVQQFNIEDLELLINNSRKSNVNIIVAAGTTISDSQKAVVLSKKYKEIYAAVGIHPQNINDEKTVNYLDKLEEFTNNSKTIMISEIGLDIQEKSVDLSIQTEFFSEQINFARSKKLPIAFHVRNAEKEALSLLHTNRINEIKSVAHYFSGSYEYAKKLLDQNVFISVAKPFLRDEKLSDTIKQIPIEQIVIETDSYPQYFKKNRERWTEPRDLMQIIKKLSQIKKMDQMYLMEIISTNSNYILNL